MSVAAQRPRYSLAEYIAFEQRSNSRHEYFEGEILAMTGGTIEHSGIGTTVTSLLTASLAGRPCRVFNSDLRVRVAASGLDTYPDASVVCGKPETDPEDPHALVNPVLLIEVTSPSSAEYDRGAKLAHYQRIPSLREVLILSHDAPRAEVWSRTESRVGSWSQTIYGVEESVRLSSLGVELSVRALYHDPLAGIA